MFGKIIGGLVLGASVSAGLVHCGMIKIWGFFYLP